jgi:hypothetical protein
MSRVCTSDRDLDLPVVIQDVVGEEESPNIRPGSLDNQTSKPA